MSPVLCLFKCVLLCCGVCSVPALWNTSNELSLFIYLLSQSYSKWQSCYVTYSKIVGTRFSSAQHLIFHYSSLHTFKKSKGVWSMNNLSIHVWWKVVFLGKTLRKLLENKFVCYWKVWAGKTYNKNVVFVELHMFPMDSLVSAGEITRHLLQSKFFACLCFWRWKVVHQELPNCVT